MAESNAPILRSRNWPSSVLGTTIQPYSHSNQVQMIWAVKRQLNPFKKWAWEPVIHIPWPLQHILPESKTQQEKHWAPQFRVCCLVHIMSWHELSGALAAQCLSLCHFQPTHASSLLGCLRPVTYNYPPQMSYVLGTCSILGPTVQLWFQAILKRHTTSSQGLPGGGDLTLPHIVSQAVLWDLTKSLHDFRTSIQLVCWQP